MIPCQPHVPRAAPCGSAAGPAIDSDDELLAHVARVLAEDGVSLAHHELALLVSEMQRGRARQGWVADVSTNLPPNDIIRSILDLRNADRDEAVWRTFLAAHFGWASATDEKRDSARSFLCAFGEEPVWTWQRVREHPDAFQAWIAASSARLAALQFGNHRKREHAGELWDVLSSFIDGTDEWGGRPAGVCELASEAPEGRFDELYWTLRRLYRFGRLGAFDFAMLLADLKLVDAEPGHCYLDGATGPLEGARLLWGDLPVEDLNAHAQALARRLKLSPAVIEDALCNWQKHRE